MNLFRFFDIKKLELRVFGSEDNAFYVPQARGDGYPDSDYDMLVVAKGVMRELKNIVREAEWLCMEKHNALISSIIYTPDLWTLAKDSPLGWNILRNGRK